MPIKVTCPKCQGVLHAPDDAGGKRGKCPTCGTVLAIPAGGGGLGGGLLPPPPAPVAPVPDRPAVETPFKPPAATRPLPEDDLLPPSDARRSSFGSMGRPEAEPRKASAGKLPPPSFAAEPPRKQPADPFARPGKPAAEAVTEDVVRGWRRARRGLWWVGLGQFVFLLAVLGPAGIAIAENYGTALPNADPGFLKIAGLSQAMEIRAGAVLIPAALGLLLVTLGRFGVAGAPRASYSRGLARAAAFATLFTLAGVIAALAPTVAQVFTGILPPAASLGVKPEEWTVDVWTKLTTSVLPPDDWNGISQRAGLLVAGVFVLLAEVWFASALGRMGAALGNDRLASRSTRFLVYTGLTFFVVVAGVVYYLAYTAQADKFLGEQFTPNWNKLAPHRATARCGLVILAGLVVWFWNARLVGGARRAIRSWLEQNEPAAA
ncbi:MAG: hypothetical protein U0871_22110 [Gemmataceae bacterium]